MTTDLKTVFAEAGVDFEKLQATEHALRAKALNSAPRSIPKLIVPPLPKKAATCTRCRAVLKPHEEFVCDGCDESLTESWTVKVPDSQPAPVVRLADCWPKKHVRQVSQFHGPALQAAEQLLPRIMGGAMLLLHGPQGRGKTGMATWWEWKRVRGRGKAGMFDTVQGIFARIRASWANKNTDDVVRELARTPYLVLDELDERANSEWEEYTLFDLLNRRYNDELATVLISNLSAEELKKAYKPKFLSRISENGGLVPCHWASYR